MPRQLEATKFAELLADPTTTLEEEFIRPAWMSCPDDKLDPGEILVREDRWKKVGPLLAPNCIAQILCAETRPATMKQHQEETGVAASVIYQLLTTFWWFGGDAESIMGRNALLELRRQKGGPGRRKVGGKIKVGAPRAAYTLTGDSKKNGRNLEPEDRVLIKAALEEWYVGGQISQEETFDRMVARDYKSQALRRLFGKTRAKALLPILSVTQFLREARLIRQECGLDAKRMGPIDYVQKSAPRVGSASDYSIGPGDVYDIDAMQDCVIELTLTQDASVALGKPTVTLVVDRYSLAIAGFDDSIGEESWDTYRHALFCAFTPKDELLKKSGFKEKASKLWPMDIVSRQLFGDRGPLKSADAWRALARMNIGRALPPAQRADLKGVVESVQGILQRKLESQPGASRVGPGRRAKEQTAGARSNASISRARFRELLIAAILDWNHYGDASRVYTPPMAAAGVKTNPLSIFAWGVRNTTGIKARQVPMAEIFAQLLRSKRVAVGRKGVQHERDYYSSSRLIQSGMMTKTSRRTVFIDIFFDPFDPQFVYWRPTEGEWDALLISDLGQRKYRNLTVEDAEYFHLQRAAARSDVRQGRARKSHLRKVEAQGVSAAIRAVDGGASPSRPAANKATIRQNKSRAHALEKHEAAEDARTLMGVSDATREEAAGIRPAQVALSAPPGSGEGRDQSDLAAEALLDALLGRKTESEGT